MKKTWITIVILLLLSVAIVVFPLLSIHDSEFGGADGQAEEIIAQINPDYVPWAENPISPPGAETESLLFALQAALGAGVICFGFGWLGARKKYKKEEA